MLDKELSVEERRKSAIKGAGYTLEKAAEKLDISRTTLYFQLGKADLPPEFVQNVKQRIGVDLSNITAFTTNYDRTLQETFDVEKHGVTKEVAEASGSDKKDSVLPMTLEVAVKVLGELYRSPEFLKQIRGISKMITEPAVRKQRVGFAYDEADALVQLYNQKMLA